MFLSFYYKFKNMVPFGYTEYTEELDFIAKQYEMGLITSQEFIERLNSLYPKASQKDIIKAWNSILLDFPEYRLKFIENLNT